MIHTMWWHTFVQHISGYCERASPFPPRFFPSSPNHYPTSPTLHYFSVISILCVRFWMIYLSKSNRRSPNHYPTSPTLHYLFKEYHFWHIYLSISNQSLDPVHVGPATDRGPSAYVYTGLNAFYPKKWSLTDLVTDIQTEWQPLMVQKWSLTD